MEKSNLLLMAYSGINSDLSAVILVNFSRISLHRLSALQITVTLCWKNPLQ
jgi:hypothetical protein